jgi:hypothetical protein
MENFENFVEGAIIPPHVQLQMAQAQFQMQNAQDNFEELIQNQPFDLAQNVNFGEEIPENDGPEGLLQQLQNPPGDDNNNDRPDDVNNNTTDPNLRQQQQMLLEQQLQQHQEQLQQQLENELQQQLPEKAEDQDDVKFIAGPDNNTSSEVQIITNGEGKKDKRKKKEKEEEKSFFPY